MPPMPSVRSRSLVALAAALVLSSCATIGGPKHSMEELRAIYGDFGNLQDMVLESGNLEHVESLIQLSNDFDRGGMLPDANAEFCKPMEEAIRNGTNVNKKFDGGGNFLMAASALGCTETVRILIDAGANLNARSDDGINDGITALMAASGEGHTETARMLIDAGANVNAKDDKGWTALMFASRLGHTETARMLIDAGANVNAKNDKGWTALMWASRRDHTETARMLKAAGATE